MLVSAVYINYDLISIITSIISSIITFFAVIVALFQFKAQFKKRINVVYNNNYGQIEKNSSHTKSVEFIIFNAGFSKVAICNIYLDKKKEFALPIMENNQLFQKPKIIDVGESYSVLVDFGDLIHGIEYLVSKNKILLKRKIVFMVEDVSGDIVKIKTKHTYEQYLKWSTSETCLLPKLS